jgi:hypothetical protein
MTISSPLTPAPDPIEVQDTWAIRATAHAAEWTVLRAAQRFQRSVSDFDAARVMLSLEQGIRSHRNRAGRWLVPAGTPMSGLATFKLSTVISEMIRTGLVRHYIDEDGDHLLPAPVHLRHVHQDATQTSACLFVGEDLGPMRSRLVDRLDLVDCLACEAAVSTGTVRGL